MQLNLISWDFNNPNEYFSLKKWINKTFLSRSRLNRFGILFMFLLTIEKRCQCRRNWFEFNQLKQMKWEFLIMFNTTLTWINFKFIRLIKRSNFDFDLDLWRKMEWIQLLSSFIIVADWLIYGRAETRKWSRDTHRTNRPITINVKKN